ncbi:hypothetical protein GCM10022402_30980 [Salinactinospora qingdaonensis]|uniref:Transposase n=1 Tax=Salinactinospora qingdaonensis TaxID=702744 RepID=A0ABP7FVR5_9ACTN
MPSRPGTHPAAITTLDVNRHTAYSHLTTARPPAESPNGKTTVALPRKLPTGPQSRD